MTRILSAFLMSLVFCTHAIAKDGYTIKLKFNNAKKQTVALAHYYGKALPTIYKVDSAVIDDNGIAMLKNESPVIGGLYLIILQEQQGYFEFLLDNGQSLDITVDAAKLPLGISYKNSPDNERFLEYTKYLAGVGEEHRKLSEDIAKAKTKEDTAKVDAEYRALGKRVSAYRNNYIRKYPNTLLANIFRALEMPDFPGKDLEGKSRDEKWYKAYKAHYWDNVDFKDERLVYTPIMDNKLHEYFTKLVDAMPDTFNMEADKVIEQARASKEMFKYVVHWLSTYAQESNIMGMDAVFVHLVEKYYMRGDAFWLNSGTLQKYIDRAKSIAPNVLGNLAPELKMKNIDDTPFSLHDVDAKYLLLIFWSPDCGHCREEIPRIDSVLKAEGLYKKGMKVVGVNIDKETDKWKDLIKQHSLDNWINVYDPERTSNLRASYDVYGTPTIYLLDERKIIQGKKLDHTNILTVVDILEREEKEAAKN